MARITLAEAQAWLETTKMTISSLDTSLLNHVETEVLARIASVVDTSSWTTDVTTPALIRTIIAKTYVVWLYRRQYSEDQDQDNDYAARLELNAELLIAGIIGGTIDIPGGPTEVSTDPVFYPTDASSAQEATSDDPSLGGPYFSMGTRW